MCIPHFVVFSSFDGHLHYFYLFAIVNICVGSGYINIFKFLLSVLLDIYPKEGLLNQMVILRSDPTFKDHETNRKTGEAQKDRSD